MKGLFIGLNTIDIQFLVEQYIEENTKAKAIDDNVAVGGPATNAAVACAYLNGKATLISPVGKHAFHPFIQGDLEKYGVHLLDPIENTAAEPIFASIINSAQNGSRTVYSYFPKANDLKEINYADQGADVILFDGFYPVMTKHILESQHTKNATVVFDGGSWKEGLEAFIPTIDIAICSEHFRPPGAASFIDVFQFFKENGVDKVAITQGDKPIIVSENGSFNEIPVPLIKPVDTLGAGDFFHGAFCYYYGISNDFIESLKKASAVAAESCQHFGTRSWMKMK